MAIGTAIGGARTSSPSTVARLIALPAQSERAARRAAPRGHRQHRDEAGTRRGVCLEHVLCLARLTCPPTIAHPPRTPTARQSREHSPPCSSSPTAAYYRTPSAARHARRGRLAAPRRQPPLSAASRRPRDGECSAEHCYVSAGRTTTRAAAGAAGGPWRGANAPTQPMRTGAWWGMETCGTAWEGAHECRFEVSGPGTMSSAAGTMSSTHKYAGSNVSV